MQYMNSFECLSKLDTTITIHHAKMTTREEEKKSDPSTYGSKQQRKTNIGNGKRKKMKNKK